MDINYNVRFHYCQVRIRNDDCYLKIIDGKNEKHEDMCFFISLINYESKTQCTT